MKHRMRISVKAHICVRLSASAFFIFLLHLPVNAYSSRRQTPVVEVVRDNAESVVNISTEHIVFLRENPYWGEYGDAFDLLFEQFFGVYRHTHALRLQSVGSGVILDGRGIIVTNAHVVNMASGVFVVLNDGTSLEGRVVYEDLDNDLAFIKINPPRKLKAIRLGDTDGVMIGETAVAIGNPLGLENSVTVGVVSGKDRELYLPGSDVICRGLLQTDTPINPGNSGGALLNLDGELIGINVAVVQNSQSIGFAVPVSAVKSNLKSFINEGFTRQPDLSAGGFYGKEDDELSKSSGYGLREHAGISGGIESGIQEAEDSYLLRVDISGLDKDTLDIEIKEGVVKVSGEYSSAAAESGKDGSYGMRLYGFYSKIIPLPVAAGVQRAKTAITGDILQITFPKKSSRIN